MVDLMGMSTGVYVIKAEAAATMPLHQNLAAEFRNHKRTIADKRDEIDLAINSGKASKDIQLLLDNAKTLIANLNKCVQGFDALHKLHCKAT